MKSAVTIPNTPSLVISFSIARSTSVYAYIKLNP
jgi:hypothetical protein